MNLYKLWSFLFGWDYIYWDDGISSGISKIRLNIITGEGVFKRKISYSRIIENDIKVIFLTCDRSKYLKKFDKFVKTTIH